MPWTEKQTIPYGAIERVWVPGWTEAELIPYGGQQRVYEDRPRHYILPHESQEFGSRDQIERLR